MEALRDVFPDPLSITAAAARIVASAGSSLATAAEWPDGPGSTPRLTASMHRPLV
jgi:hypothetical protein